ncbi:MAG: C10 family peptidase [Bacteroidetes bacterium]|nr:C10 family peptidase [Bacteroidota bacterium]
MKNRYLIFTILLSFAINFAVQAKKVEIEKAEKIAKNLYQDKAQFNSNFKLNANLISNSISIKDNNNEPVLYIFNYTTGGFAIVSADDIAYPVLGYSFESSFPTENQPESFKWWINSYKQEILDAKASNMAQTGEVKQAWDDILGYPSTSASKQIQAVTPLTIAIWDQGQFYNDSCPADAAAPSGYGGHVPVGCVATTMSQIMYYWKYPAHGTGSKYYWHNTYGAQTANFGAATYNWNGMLPQATTSNPEMAKIGRHAGVSVNMNYAPDGSGAFSPSVPGSLKGYFNYDNSCAIHDKSSYTTANWNALLKGDLDLGRPIYYSGQDPTAGGHAFVCDGYDNSTTTMYHFNWGWSGSGNGYFLLTTMNSGNGNFTQSQSAVTSIIPPASSYPLYCTGVTTTLSTHTGSFEDGSGPVNNYQDNVDCSWLIAPNNGETAVQLTFLSMDNLAGDTVIVYNGPNSSSPILGKYSGTTFPTTSINSTTGQMFVRFVSNGYGNSKGWSAKYTSTSPVFCTGVVTLTAPSGTFADGSGAYNYSENANCKWLIQPAGASQITINFNSLDVEMTNDKIKIYDYDLNVLLATVTGNVIPAPIVCNTTSVLCIFSSNNSVNKTGWEISYSSLTGVDENQFVNNFCIFPNPATNNLNLKFDVNSTQNINIKLNNITGQTVYADSKSNFNGTFDKTIDVSSLSKGVYFVNILTEKASITRKIVLQ